MKKEKLVKILKDNLCAISCDGLEEAAEIILQYASQQSNAADTKYTGRCYNCGALVWPDGKEFDYTP